ncbi:hypothetical protein F511_38045 [Dorcoceras hygrometricum]|uniref:Uncharacterized protein n=1 Tax=Dorcoceras hygrometricum TaxID=472368 RepID=A0A2Z7CGN1_9LAMI|nr:hypothetical protein F511_38045 [Dorcoceras hygrometricum]
MKRRRTGRGIQSQATVHQQMILGDSDSKTMSFGLMDTTTFCLRAKDSADSFCDDKKPADSYSYPESAVARFQQVHYLKITSRSVIVLEKESVAGITHMLKRNQQVHSFKCVPVAELQTTKEELVIKREFKKSAVAIKMSAEDFNQSQQFWMSTAELYSNVEDDKKPAKERTQRTIPVGTLQNTFQTGRICVQRIEFKQRLIYKKNAIEEVSTQRKS